MKPIQRFVVAAVAFTATALISTAATAQFVKGNEAVTVLADGSRKVETPPLPSGSLAKPCPASRAGCAGGGWMMLETGDGLKECTEIYGRPGTCRDSSYGTEKRSRLWIVKSDGRWLQCTYPAIAKSCVSTKSLPTSAVQ